MMTKEGMMRTIFTFILMLLMVTTLSAQSLFKTGGEKLSRDERKALRLTEEKKRIEEVNSLLNDTLFVLEADRLVDPKGASMMVEPSLNFVALVQGDAVFQTGSNAGFGRNGVGGRTLTGRVTDYQVVPTGKKGYHQVTAMVSTDLGFFRFEIKVSPTGNASALVSDQMKNTLNYRGRLVSLKKSIVYEGVNF